MASLQQQSYLFHTPLAFDAPLGGPRRNIVMTFGTEKLEWCGYSTVKKSSSAAINTAAYYQRCVITCETVAVHRRPRLQHLPIAALTQAVKPDIGLESRFLPTPLAFDAPVREEGVPVGILLCRLERKN